MSGPAGFPKHFMNNPLNNINDSLPTPHIGNPRKPATTHRTKSVQ